MGYSDMAVMVAVVAALVACSVVVVEGQQNPPACAAKLVPCAPYLNSTSPPDECCKPLREAVEKELDCLCNLYKNPQFLQVFKINLTQALALPKYCKINGDLSACTKSGSTPSPLTPPPPGETGRGSSGAGNIAWTGVSSLLLFGVSMVVYLGTSDALCIS